MNEINEKVCLSSKTIDLAENETYLELTNRVCYYDEKNLNDMLLPSDTAEEKAQTLINMPVVGRYRTNSKGEATFSGHELYIDNEGDVCFATDNIGVHTEIYIQDDTVDVNGVLKTLPCLFAKYRIWKRNKNVVAAVRRLYSEGKLYSSWEISTSAYEFKDGIKKITDYVFLANCLLGYEYSFPAYGKDAKAISLSTKECQLLAAEALSKDILESLNINSTEKEEQNLSKEINKETSEEKVEDVNTSEQDNLDKENTETSEKEISALTEWDLRSKIRTACKAKLNDWCYIAFHFPVDKTVWVEKDSRESELDYILFTYEVVNDVVTVSEPQNVKLTVNISEINSKIASLESEISEKNNAIVKASEEITNLKTEVSNLQPFKEKFEKAEQDRIENEIAEKKEQLISKYLKTGFITKEEIDSSSDVKGYFDSLDEKSLNEIVATRYMASLENKDKPNNVESSDVKKMPTANLLNDDESTDKKSIIKKYIGGK